MASLTLQVKAHPGCTIDTAFEQALALANRNSITVQFDFNDVVCMAVPGGSAEAGVENFHAAIKSKRNFIRIATTHKKEQQ